MLETKRCYFRKWELSDAQRLFELAKEKEVALPCGWKPHTSIDNSTFILKNVLQRENTFAICLKENNELIGNISIMNYKNSNFARNEYEGEIGYWFGKKYWNHGYATECVEEILSYGFHHLHLNLIWGGHFPENIASRNVQLKCGLKPSHIIKNLYITSLEEEKDLHALNLSKFDYIKERASFRSANINDAKILSQLENECFPVEEAVSYETIKERLTYYANHFYLLFINDQLISFIDGMCTNEEELQDYMYENASLHDENGDWQMIFGVNTKIEYRNNGYGSLIMKIMINEAKRQNRKGLVLTCKKEKLNFYSRLGFINEGVSTSTHGNTTWYKMRLTFK